MYTLYLGDECFYDPRLQDAAYMASKVSLDWEINKAGELTFVLAPSNCMYGQFVISESIVYFHQGKLETPIWAGRVSSIEYDFYNVCTITCEGIMSYMNDLISQPFIVIYKDNNDQNVRTSFADENHTPINIVKKVMEEILDNASDESVVSKQITDPAKKFHFIDRTSHGFPTMDNYTDDDVWEINDIVNTYSTVMDKLQQLIEYFGGFFIAYPHKVDHNDGSSEVLNYAYYAKGNNPLRDSGQTIEFGQNMLDVSQYEKIDNLFTGVYALGKSNDDAAQGLEDRLTLSGNPVLWNTTAKQKYGEIVAAVTWDSCETETELRKTAQKYLDDKSGKTLDELTIRAVDMWLIDADEDDIRLGDGVTVQSIPHDIDDTTLICTKTVIDVDSPENSEYTFGEIPKGLTDY